MAGAYKSWFTVLYDSRKEAVYADRSRRFAPPVRMTVTLEISAQVLLHNSLSNGKKFPIRGVSARLFNDRSMMIAYINITVSHSRYLLSPALSLREVSVDKRRQAPVDSKQIKIRFPVKKNKYLQISTVLESHLLYLVVLIAAQAPLEFLSIEGPRYSIRQPFPLDR